MSTAPQAPIRVVVADDETHILNVVALKLRRAGFEVHTANDGAEALRVARKVGPAAVVTDFHMPHLNGLEFCRAYRDAGGRAPAILLTARDTTLAEPEMAAAGIVRVVNKPFSPRELVAAVQACVGGEMARAA